jgi:hypothetical protein
LVEDDESFIFNKIVRPAFARAVCAALSISPFKIADEKVLSFTMSQHSRLGKHSCAFGLPSEIISRIVSASESLDPCASGNKNRASLACGSSDLTRWSVFAHGQLTKRNTSALSCIIGVRRTILLLVSRPSRLSESLQKEATEMMEVTAQLSSASKALWYDAYVSENVVSPPFLHL